MKKIGIYAASMGENAFGVSKTYLTFAEQFGVARILTPDNVFDDSIDMLLLQGGLDVSPKAYNRIPNYYTTNTDVFKQHVYDTCLPNYIQAQIPVFGICLGFQQLASHFGSILTQDLAYHPTSKSRNEKAHDVSFENGGEFYTGEKAKRKMDVNSFHHQCVVRRDLSGVLSPLCVAENEEYKHDRNMDIIESFRHESLPVAGVQWHPEDMFSYYVYNLVSDLLTHGEYIRSSAQTTVVEEQTTVQSKITS